jgi:hypothetical protein
VIATNYANHTGVKGETEGMMVVGVRERVWFPVKETKGMVVVWEREGCLVSCP